MRNAYVHGMLEIFDIVFQLRVQNVGGCGDAMCNGLLYIDLFNFIHVKIKAFHSKEFVMHSLMN